MLLIPLTALCSPIYFFCKSEMFTVFESLKELGPAMLCHLWSGAAYAIVYALLAWQCFQVTPSACIGHYVNIYSCYLVIAEKYTFMWHCKVCKKFFIDVNLFALYKYLYPVRHPMAILLVRLLELRKN